MSMSELAVTPAEHAVLAAAFRDDTRPDAWMPPGEDYRQRAYQCFELALPEAELRIVPEPPPYWQSTAVNPLLGGIERRFQLIPAAHPATAVVRKIIAGVTVPLLAAQVLQPERTPRCLVDAHYIRILAPGRPAPEGIHRDGLLAGSAHLIDRLNITGGKTEIYDGRTRELLSEFELTEPLDSYVFDDERVLHYAHPIDVAVPGRPAHRDVLLIGFRPDER
ncbi:2OG-Fe dioxygenase family protein [Nocardia sp. NPDC059240]|uniref:2OG-Fe dioxygenase family protein n=1 Tax=Nocardia sp. NPDC059240 TaxID=3346786 RepID=UPI0036CFBB56